MVGGGTPRAVILGSTALMYGGRFLGQIQPCEHGGSVTGIV